MQVQALELQRIYLLFFLTIFLFFKIELGLQPKASSGLFTESISLSSQVSHAEAVRVYDAGTGAGITQETALELHRKQHWNYTGNSTGITEEAVNVLVCLVHVLC